MFTSLATGQSLFYVSIVSFICSLTGALMPLIYDRYIKEERISLEDFIVHVLINTMTGVILTLIFVPKITTLSTLIGVSWLLGLSGGKLFAIITKFQLKGGSIKTPFGEIKFDISNDNDGGSGG